MPQFLHNSGKSYAGHSLFYTQRSGAEKTMAELMLARQNLNAVKNAKKTHEQVKEGLNYLINNITLKNVNQIEEELQTRFPKLFNSLKNINIVQTYISAFKDFEEKHNEGNRFICNSML